MSDELQRQIGELTGIVKCIKDNTDKIPDMSIMLALHEASIIDMRPKVESHENISQKAAGIAMFCGLMAGAFSTMVKGFFNG